jgi:hypothetical protein
VQLCALVCSCYKVLSYVTGLSLYYSRSIRFRVVVQKHKVEASANQRLVIVILGELYTRLSKRNVVPVHAMKIHRGSIGIVLLFLNLGARW